MKKFIHIGLRKLGYRIVRIEDRPRPSEGLEPFFILLRRFGFAPKHILDVGANHGLWTREAMKFFPDAHYTLVEPQDYLKTHIQDLIDWGCKIQWINAGASDRRGHCSSRSPTRRQLQLCVLRGTSARRRVPADDWSRSRQ